MPIGVFGPYCLEKLGPDTHTVVGTEVGFVKVPGSNIHHLVKAFPKKLKSRSTYQGKFQNEKSGCGFLFLSSGLRMSSGEITQKESCFFKDLRARRDTSRPERERAKEGGRKTGSAMKVIVFISGFLNRGISDILGGIILCCGKLSCAL